MSLTFNELTSSEAFNNLGFEDQDKVAKDFLSKEVDQGSQSDFAAFLNTKESSLKRRYDGESERRKLYLDEEYKALNNLKQKWIMDGAGPKIQGALSEYLRAAGKTKQSEGNDWDKISKANEAARKILAHDEDWVTKQRVRDKGKLGANAIAGLGEAKTFLGQAGDLATGVVKGVVTAPETLVSFFDPKPVKVLLEGSVEAGVWQDFEELDRYKDVKLTDSVKDIVRNNREKLENYLKENPTAGLAGNREWQLKEFKYEGKEGSDDARAKWAKETVQEIIDRWDIEDLPFRPPKPGKLAEEFADPRRRLQVSRGRKELKELGYSDKQVEELLQQTFDRDKPFDNKEHIVKVDAFGEAELNPESLLRFSEDQIVSKIKNSGLPKAVQERAIKKVAAESSAALMEFFRVYDSSVLDKYEGASDQEKINAFLESKEGQGFLGEAGKAFYIGWKRWQSAAYGMTAGTLGMFGAEETSAKFQEAAMLAGLETSYLKEGFWTGVAGETLGLLGDVYLSRGGAAAAGKLASVGKYKKYKEVTAAQATSGTGRTLRKADGTKLTPTEAAGYEKWRKIKEKAHAVGVATGSGYSAASRVMAEAFNSDMDRDDAFILGLEQFLITGLITYKGAKTGADRFAMGNAIKSDGRTFAQFIAKDMLGEGAEEFIDEFISGAIVQAELNPDLTVDEIASDATQAFFLSMALSGVTVGPGQAKRSISALKQRVTGATQTGIGEKDGGVAEPLETTVDTSTPEGKALAPESLNAAAETTSPEAEKVDLDSIEAAEEVVPEKAPPKEEVPETDAPSKELPISQQPSKEFLPKATENVEPAPTRRDFDKDDFEGYKKASDEWDEKYQKTHNVDGTPIRPTRHTDVSQDLFRLEQETGKTGTQEDVDLARLNAVGVASDIQAPTAITKLLDAGWDWDDSQKRMVNPANADESTADGLKRIREESATPTEPAGTPKEGLKGEPGVKGEPATDTSEPVVKPTVAPSAEPVFGKEEKTPTLKIQGQEGPGLNASKEEIFGKPGANQIINPKVPVSNFSLKEEGDVLRLVKGKGKAEQTTERIYNPKTKTWSTSGTKDAQFKVGSLMFTTKKKLRQDKQGLKEGLAPTKIDVEGKADKADLGGRFIGANNAPLNTQQSRSQLIANKNARAELEALYSDKTVGIDSTSDTAVKVSGKGEITLNPEHADLQGKNAAEVLRGDVIPEATALHAAVTSDQEVDKVVPVLKEANLLDSANDNLVNPDDSTKAKAVIGKVILGADDSLRSRFVDAIAGADQDTKDQIQAVLENVWNSKAEAGPIVSNRFENSVNKLDSLTKEKDIPSLFTAATFREGGVNPIQERTGLLYVKQSEFNKIASAVPSKPGEQVERVNINSSVTDHPGIKDNVKQGSVLEVRADNNESVIIDRYFVKSVHKRADGTQQHHLEKIPKEVDGVRKLLDNYYNNQEQKDQILEAIDLLGKTTNPGKIQSILEPLVKDAVSEVAGSDYAENKLVFVTSDEAATAGNPYSHGYVRHVDGEPKIHINLDVLHVHLINISKSLEGANDLARETVAEDFSNFFNSVAFEETAHVYANELFEDSEVVETVDEWWEMASSSDPKIADRAKGAFVHWYRRSEGLTEVSPKTTDDYIADVKKIADSYDEQLEAAKGDKTQTDWYKIRYRMGHETMAQLTSQIKTGNTALNLQGVMQRWINDFVDTKAGKATDATGKVGRFINRLVEMAQRAFESVNNYFLAHRALSQMPPRMEKMINQLDRAMQTGGVKVRDVFDVEARALERMSDDLDSTLNSVDEDWDLNEEQAKLQEQLRFLQRLLVDASLPDDEQAGVGNFINYVYSNRSNEWRLVVSDDMVGAIPSENLTAINNSLAIINDSGRPTLMANNAIQAREYESVLSRLGVSGVTRVSPSETRARVLRDDEFGRMPRDPQLERPTIREEGEEVPAGLQNIATSEGYQPATVEGEVNLGRKPVFDERPATRRDAERPIGGLRVVGRSRAEKQAIIRTLEEDAAQAIAQHIPSRSARDLGTMEGVTPTSEEAILEEFTNVLSRQHNARVIQKHRDLAGIAPNQPAPPEGPFRKQKEDADSRLAKAVEGLSDNVKARIIELGDFSGGIKQQILDQPAKFAAFIDPETSKALSEKKNQKQFDEIRAALDQRAKFIEDSLAAPGAYGDQWRAWKRSIDQSNSLLSRLYANLPGRVGVNSMQDLLEEWGTAKEASRLRGLDNIFTGAINRLATVEGVLDAERANAIRAELDRQQLLMESTVKMQNLAEEMDFAMLGGRLPRRLKQRRRERNQVWDYAQLQRDGEVSVPHGLPQALRGFDGISDITETIEPIDLESGTNVETLKLAGLSVDDTRARIDELHEKIVNLPKDHPDAIAARKELRKPEVQKVLSGYGIRIQHQDSSGRVFGLTFETVPDPALASVLNGPGGDDAIEFIGNNVADAKKAILSLVGGDQDLADEALTGKGTFPSERIDRTAVASNMQMQAYEEGGQLAENLVHSVFRAESGTDYDLLTTAGYSAFEDQVARGTYINPDTNEEETNYETVYRLDPYNLFAVEDWPDLNNKETGEFIGPEEGFDKLLITGHVGKLILELNTKLQAMEHGSSNQKPAVLSTANGLTPAGYSYQLVAYPLVDFLAKTKNLNLGGAPFVDRLVFALEQSDAPGDKDAAFRLRKIYANLSPGLENASVFAGHREASDVRTKLFNDFVNLRRLTKSSNAAYSSSLRQLKTSQALRRIVRQSELATTDRRKDAQVTRYPVDLEYLARLESQARTARNMLERSESERAEAGTTAHGSAIHALPVVNPRIYLREMSKYLNREDPFVFKGEPGLDAGATSATNANVADAVGNESLMRMGDNPSHNLRSPNRESMSDKELWVLQQRERNEENRMNLLRAEILGAMHQYNRDTIRSVINSPEFYTDVQAPDGTIVRQYDTHAIDQYLYNELERMGEDSPENENVRMPIPINAEDTPVDLAAELAEAMGEEAAKPRPKTRPKHKRIGSVNKRLKALRKEFGYLERDPDAADVADVDEQNDIGLALTYILENGGDVYDGFLWNEGNLDVIANAAPRHSQTRWTALTYLASKIPGLKTIKGEAHRDSADIVPTVAFVPSPETPVLLLPFAHGSYIDDKNIHDAMVGMLKFLNDHANVDVAKMAESVLQPVAEYEMDFVTIATPDAEPGQEVDLGTVGDEQFRERKLVSNLGGESVSSRLRSYVRDTALRERQNIKSPEDEANDLQLEIESLQKQIEEDGDESGALKQEAAVLAKRQNELRRIATPRSLQGKTGKAVLESAKKNLAARKKERDFITRQRDRLKRKIKGAERWRKRNKTKRKEVLVYNFETDTVESVTRRVPTADRALKPGLYVKVNPDAFNLPANRKLVLLSQATELVKLANSSLKSRNAEINAAERVVTENIKLDKFQEDMANRKPFTEREDAEAAVAKVFKKDADRGLSIFNIDEVFDKEGNVVGYKPSLKEDYMELNEWINLDVRMLGIRAALDGQVDTILSHLNKGNESLYGNPRFAASNIEKSKDSPEIAADVVATFLASDNLKTLLSHLSIGRSVDVNATSPGYDPGLAGVMVRSDLLTLSKDLRPVPWVEEIYSGTEESAKAAVDQPDDAGRGEMRRQLERQFPGVVESFKQFVEESPYELTNDEQRQRIEKEFMLKFNPYLAVHGALDNGNKNTIDLYANLLDIVPKYKTEPTGLTPVAIEDKIGISEIEARQLMAVMSDSDISDIVSRHVPDAGAGLFDKRYSLREIQDFDQVVIEALKEEYKEIRRSEIEEDAAENDGAGALLPGQNNRFDPDSRADLFRNRDMARARLAIANALGAEEGELNVTGLVQRNEDGTINGDLLRAKLKAAGLETEIGRGGLALKDIVEEQARLMHEAERTRLAFNAGKRDRRNKLLVRIDELETTINKLSDIRPDFEKALDGKRFLESVEDSVVFDLFNGDTESAKLFHQIQEIFFKNRSEQLRSIAEELVEADLLAKQRAERPFTTIRDVLDREANIQTVEVIQNLLATEVDEEGNVLPLEPLQMIGSQLQLGGLFMGADPETNEANLNNLLYQIAKIKGWKKHEYFFKAKHLREIPHKVLPSGSIKISSRVTNARLDEDGNVIPPEPVSSDIVLDLSEALSNRMAKSSLWQSKVQKMEDNINPPPGATPAALALYARNIAKYGENTTRGLENQRALLEGARALSLWVDKLANVVDAELTEGIMRGPFSKDGESILPEIPTAPYHALTSTNLTRAELRQLKNIRIEIERAALDGSISSDVRQLQSFVRSMSDPGKVIQRLRDLSLSKAIDNMRKSELPVSVAGDITGMAMPGLRIPHSFGGESIRDILLESRQFTGSYTAAREQRVNFVLDKIAPYFKLNMDTLLGSEGLPEDHPSFTKGLIHNAMDKNLRRSESELQSAETELAAMLDEEVRQSFIRPEYTGAISGYVDEEYRKVQVKDYHQTGIEGEISDAVELTQRVINRLAGKHSSYQDEFFKNSDNIDPLLAHQESLRLADDAITRRSQVRRAVEKAKGRRYTVSEDLLVPTDIDERIDRYLEIHNVKLSDEARSKAYNDLALFTSAGISPDDKDLNDVNPAYDPGDDYFDLNRKVTDATWEAMRNSRHFYYADKEFALTKAEKEVYEGADELLENMENTHKEMYAYVYNAKQFIDTLVRDAAAGNSISVGLNEVGDMELRNLHKRLTTFVDAMERLKQGKEISASEPSKLFSVYADTKGFVTALKTVRTLEAGFIDNQTLIKGDAMWTGLMHHDAKIMSLFAGTLEAQSVAHGLTHLLNYGPTVNSKVAGGRSGARAMIDELQKSLAEALPRRKGVKGILKSGLEGASVPLPKGKKLKIEEAQVDAEKAALGYGFQTIISYLNAPQFKGRTLSERAKAIIQMFDASDASFANAFQQIESKDWGEKTKEAIANSDYKFLADHGIYKVVKENFYSTLEEISQGGVTDITQAVALLEAKAPDFDRDARKYGEHLNAAFGLVTKLYQAQAQLIPKSETVGSTDQRFDGWAANGTQHIISKMPRVAFKTQRAFVTSEDLNKAKEGEARATPPTFSEELSMTRASFLKKKELVYSDDVIQVLDFNGLRAPMQLLSDMATRMNISPALQVVQAITGENRHQEGQGQRSVLNTIPGKEGALKLYFGDLKEKSSGNKNMGSRVGDIAQILGYLHQDIVAEDLQRDVPNSSLQDAIEYIGKAGMVSRLFSFSQWWKQSVWGVGAYSLILDGMSNKGALLEFTRQGMGRMGLNVSGIRRTKDAEGYRTRNAKIANFIKKKAHLVYLRNAEGQEMMGDALEATVPLHKNRGLQLVEEDNALRRGSRATKNKISSTLRNVARRTGRTFDKSLSLTIAASEKWAIHTIVMSELKKRALELYDNHSTDPKLQGHKPPTIDSLIDDVNPHPIVGYLTSADYGNAALTGIKLLGQSDTSMKGVFFRRRKEIGADLARGAFITFGNHLISTAAFTVAGRQMMKHGDAKTKRAGKRLMKTSVAQNMAFTFFNHRVITAIAGGILSGKFLPGGDEEEEDRKSEEFQRAMYGIPPKGEDPTGRDYAMAFFSRVLGGASKPIGYDSRRDEFSDAKKRQYWARHWAMTAAEYMPHAPTRFIPPFLNPIWYGTTIGGHDFVKGLVPLGVSAGITKENVFYHGYNEAGATVFGAPEGGDYPEWLGDLTEDRPWLKAGVDTVTWNAYWMSYLFGNHLSGASYPAMGIDYFYQPVRRFLNKGEEADIGLSGWAALAGTLVPYVGTNRDTRKWLFETYDKQADTKLWSSQAGSMFGGKKEPDIPSFGSPRSRRRRGGRGGGRRSGSR